MGCCSGGDLGRVIGARVVNFRSVASRTARVRSSKTRSSKPYSSSEAVIGEHSRPTGQTLIHSDASNASGSMYVIHYIRKHKTRQNNLKDYKGARPYTRGSISSNRKLQTLGPSCLEPYVSVSVKEQSQGMHTQEVPEPCQRLVRWSVWHLPLWRGAANVLQSDNGGCENEAFTRKLGALNARTL